MALPQILPRGGYNFSAENQIGSYKGRGGEEGKTQPAQQQTCGKQTGTYQKNFAVGIAVFVVMPMMIMAAGAAFVVMPMVIVAAGAAFVVMPMVIVAAGAAFVMMLMVIVAAGAAFVMMPMVIMAAGAAFVVMFVVAVTAGTIIMVVIVTAGAAAMRMFVMGRGSGQDHGVAFDGACKNRQFFDQCVRIGGSNAQLAGGECNGGRFHFGQGVEFCLNFSRTICTVQIFYDVYFLLHTVSSHKTTYEQTFI